MSSSDESGGTHVPPTPEFDGATARERIQAAIARLKAAVVAIETSDAEVAGNPPQRARATDEAEALMDWLRLDMTGRHFGLPAVAYIDIPALDETPPAVNAPGPVEAFSVSLGVPPEGFAAIERKDVYGLGELLASQGAGFVRNAYLALLRREPDTGGFQFFRSALSEGRLSRQQALGELRDSAEGRAANVKVRGLRTALWFHRILRIPVLGRIVGVIRYLFLLPAIARAVEALSATQAFRHEALAARVEMLAKSVESAVNEAERRRVEAFTAMREALRAQEEARQKAWRTVRGVLAASRESHQALRRWTAAFAENLVAVQRTAENLDRNTVDRETVSRIAQELRESLVLLEQFTALIDSNKGTIALLEAGTKQALLQVSALSDSQRRAMSDVEEGTKQALQKVQALDDSQRRAISRLEEGAKQALERVSALNDTQRLAKSRIEELAALIDSTGLTVPSHVLDDFYANFEDRFRGTREDIKGRLAIYISDLEKAYHATGAAPIVDVGCGRGELLEIARERGLACRGVDPNPAMVARARALGLDVVQADAVEHLKSLEAGSCSAVTAIHVIEHLRFPDMIRLFDEVLRVLRPGGVVIFETPNPENLVVGACTFWYDPTHLRPLPPEVVGYVAETSGFARIEIRRLHPAADHEHLPASTVDAVLRDRLNDVLYGPRDYAIVAYKP